MRAAGAVGQALDAFRPVTGQPLVAGLAGDRVFAAQFAERERLCGGLTDEIFAAIHDVFYIPGHG
ncbi:conserved hypothetical protein [Ricinus communis]|uniref:Uncharacterized protein n=1 Tax=Ricinus communis TaxID=3988 RepID=B9TIY4_RICCO|nr:conserved hypothetical protein [Ricinus communis]